MQISFQMIASWLAVGGLLGVAACGKKAPPEPAVETATAAPVTEAEPEPEPEAEPEPPPPPASNADFTAKVSRADGTASSGHVKRVERSEDWYADDGWTDSALKLTISLECGSEFPDVTWDKISAITISPGSLANDVSCSYSSETNPWVYTCELKTPTTAVLKDGRSCEVSSRHKWRFTFDDDSQVEFWMAKYPARQQDEITQTIDRGGENLDMYVTLQDQLREDLKTLVKGVTVQ